MGQQQMKKAKLTYFFSKCRLFLTMLLFCAVAFQTAAQLLPDDNNSGSSGNNKFNSFTDGAYSWGNGGQACEKKECVNSTCQLTPQPNGNLPNDCPNGKTARYDVDPNCVMNNNAKAGSCMDTMPVSSITRVAETNCYRNAGWSRKRNHLGTDYAAVVGTAVTAAADGTVVWAAPMNRAGRVIVMEHEKKCPCSTSGCDNKYITVYMHLLKYVVTGGSVKKGTLIGYVGGSNYDRNLNKLYDYPQENSYGPHLHFEIHSGAWNKGYETLKTSIINPLCDDIQSFCGGCSNKVEEDCTGKTNTSQWTQLDPGVAEKKVAIPPANMATGTDTEGMPSYQNTACDYNNFMLDADTCTFCPLFRVLFNTASTLAQKTYNALKDALAEVVIIAFALWVALYVLKQVSALETKKPSKMIQEIMTQAFRVLFVVLVLKASYSQVLMLTLEPVFNTGMKYVQTISGATECPTSAEYMKGVVGYEKEMNAEASGGLPISMGQNILCSIKSMQDSVWRIVAYGRECRCVGWRIKAYISRIIPRFSYVFTGDMLIIAGIILLLAFPWCLVDCVLNMSIAAALLPAAVAAWAFKITAGYLRTIWDFFLNAMFNFLFLGIILYIIMTVVNKFLQAVDQYSTDYDKLIDPIVGLAFWSVNGLKLMMVCLLGWVFLKKGKDIANEFAKAPPLNIGQKTGGLFAQVGTRLARGSKGADGKYHGGALGIVKGGAEIGGLAVDRVIGSPLRKSIGNARNKWIMNNKHSTQTTDADGNTVYELDRNIFGMRNIFHTKRRVTLGSDGETIYSKDREKIGSQIQNHIRGKFNNIRANHFQSQGTNTLALFDGELEDGQTAQLSDDGKTTSIFNKKGKLLRTQTALDDGTLEIRNADGDFIASKKTNSDGNTVLTGRRSQFVYASDGTLLSANTSYRNPFLGFRKQTLSMQNMADQSSDEPDFAIKRATNSKRMEALNKAGHGIQFAGQKLGLDPISSFGSNTQKFAQNYHVVHERDLSSRVGTTSSVSKDHLLSVRQIKNAQGEVIQEDFAFNAKYAKYMVDRNGQVNTAIMQQLEQETKLTKEQINLAMAEAVLKDRKIKLEHKFIDRNTFYEDGVLTVVQSNLDGSTTRLTTQVIGSQMLIDMEIVNKDSATHILDNGVMSRVISKKGNAEPSTHYAFNDHIVQNSSVSRLMNYNGELGRFAPTINEDAAMLGFNGHDLELFAKQEKNGEDQGYDGHFAPQERQERLNAFKEVNRFCKQAEQKMAQDLSELNKAKKDFEDLQSSLTAQNTAQLQGRLNSLSQKLQQAQAAYNNSVNEFNLYRERTNQARANLF